MNKKKMWINLVLAIVGAVVIYIGAFVLDSDSVKMISGLCLGLGAVLLGFGINGVYRSFIYSKVEDGKIRRRKNIEVNDERNVRIRDKAGAKSNHIMVYVITVFVLMLGFMNAPKLIIILAASLLVIQMVLAIFLSNYYAKKM